MVSLLIIIITCLYIDTHTHLPLSLCSTCTCIQECPLGSGHPMWEFILKETNSLILLTTCSFSSMGGAKWNLFWCCHYTGLIRQSYYWNFMGIFSLSDLEDTFLQISTIGLWSLESFDLSLMTSPESQGILCVRSLLLSALALPFSQPRLKPTHFSY